MNIKFSKIIAPIFFLGFLTVFSFSAHKAEASISDNIFGNAWSENVGWISFNNCTNPSDAATCAGVSYGVIKDSSNVVSGYAWNDNVGWISFNPTDWGTCPPNASGCTLSSFSNTWAAGGWGRALSAKDSTATGADKWDGWISLGSSSGTSYSAPFGTTNLVHSSWDTGFSGKTVYGASGYWWGADVVGWVDLTPSSSSNNNPANGGVFMMETAASMILTPSATTILSGDTVDFAWSVPSFTPTSCTGSGTGTDTDWTTPQTVSSSSGTYTNIHVPIDTTTVFTLTCTDGTSTAIGTASVTATPLTAGISYSGCVAIGDPEPELDWTTNDPSPTCTVTADPATGSNYSFSVSGTSPGTVTDNSYQYENTSYTLTCENGSGSYKATKTSGADSVNMCAPNYNITGATSCVSGFPGAVVVNNGSGTYEGTVRLSFNPLNGFVSDASISGSPYLGTLTFTPSSGFTYTSGSYNTVDTKLSLSTSDYNQLLISKSGNVIEAVDVTVTGSAQNTNPKTYTLKFCDGGGSILKPIYKPF